MPTTSAMTAHEAAITVLNGHHPATSPTTAEAQTSTAVPAAIRATTACRQRGRLCTALGGGSGRSQANGATPSGSQAGGLCWSRTAGSCVVLGSSSQKAGVSNGERTAGAGLGQE